MMKSENLKKKSKKERKLSESRKLIFSFCGYVSRHRDNRQQTNRQTDKQTTDKQTTDKRQFVWLTAATDKLINGQTLTDRQLTNRQLTVTINKCDRQLRDKLPTCRKNKIVEQTVLE